MIFIAGVSPKRKVLDQNPRRCPTCGSSQAYSQCIDHYLSLFFIPVFRVKRGEPFIACDRCAQTAGGFGPDFTGQQSDVSETCRGCGKAVEPGFTFCPHCGKRL